jgi:hypothetical protein
VPVLLQLSDLYLKKQDYVKCLSCAKRALENATQIKDADRSASAQKFVDTCGAIAQMKLMKNCISSRRELDKEYISLDNDLLTFIKEAEASPGEYMGKPSDALKYMLERSHDLRGRYQKLRCQTDFEDYFRTSVTIFIAQLETFSKTVSYLNRYFTDEDEADRMAFERYKIEFNNARNNILNNWRSEENKFEFPPVITGKGEPVDEKPATPTGNTGSSSIYR